MGQTPCTMSDSEEEIEPDLEPWMSAERTREGERVLYALEECRDGGENDKTILLAKHFIQNVLHGANETGAKETGVEIAAIKEVCDQTLTAAQSVEEKRLLSQMVHMYSHSLGDLVRTDEKDATLTEQRRRPKRSLRSRFRMGAKKVIWANRFKTASPVSNGLTPELESACSLVGSWEFDIWKVVEISQGRTLSILAVTMFDRLNLFNTLQLDRMRFTKYIRAVELAYNADIPYHTSIHAADVMQSVYYFLTRDSMTAVSGMDLMTALFSAAIHDVKHFGLTNNFLVNTEHELALRYNDTSVLENMHIATAYELLTPTTDWMQDLDKPSRRSVRKTAIAMVLATDMSNHFEHLGHLKATVVHKQLNNQTFDLSVEGEEAHKDCMLLLQTVLHAADISNPAKSVPVYHKWTDLLFEEFALQGDRERKVGLEVSPMCDRNNPNLEKSQVFFIGVMVKPMFELIVKIIPETQVCIDHLTENQEYWTRVVSSMRNSQARASQVQHTRSSHITHIECSPVKQDSDTQSHAESAVESAGLESGLDTPHVSQQ